MTTVPRWMVVAVSVLTFVAGACGGAGSGGPAPTAAPTTRATEAGTDGTEGTNALVTRVIDGDTIEVRFRGLDITVRLIGIDSPESVAPGTPVQCYAIAASDFTKRMLEGERVRLEFDVQRIDPGEQLHPEGVIGMPPEARVPVADGTGRHRIGAAGSPSVTEPCIRGNVGP